MVIVGGGVIGLLTALNLANHVGQVTLHHGADVRVEMANRWVVESKALRRSDVDLLDQITTILLGAVGLGDQLSNLTIDDTANEIVVGEIDRMVV